jgi:succinate dehydrogenase / fumarate reductase flavoprotein subunit
VNNTGLAVFLDFSPNLSTVWAQGVEAALWQPLRYVRGDYRDVESPYDNPMMIYPAIHYTMGGFWVDYELMTSIKGLFAIGECNFSDHGANRLGASVH